MNNNHKIQDAIHTELNAPKLQYSSTPRRNRNRGYQQLVVWQDSIEFYKLTWRIVKKFPYELSRVRSQAIASSDSVHRNVAEGYCRRSIREYIQHLYIALGELGESVSGFIAYRNAEQMAEADFEALDALAYKIENGMLKLVESLERKAQTGDWVDTLIVKESNSVYSADPISE